MNGEEFTTYLLQEAGVAVVPGSAFGERATHEVRISLDGTAPKSGKQNQERRRKTVRCTPRPLFRYRVA